MDRAFPRRALSASLIVAVAFVAAWGGRALLWCPAMERTVSHCCCPVNEAPETDGPSIARAACCEPKLSAAAPASSADARTPSASVSAPLLAAVLPTVPALPRDSRVASAFHVAPGRGGLAPPKHALHLRNCVQLL